MSGVGFYGLQKNLTINVFDTALGIQREEGLVLALKDTQLSGDGGQDVNKVILCLQIQLFFFFFASQLCARHLRHERCRG